MSKLNWNIVHECDDEETFKERYGFAMETLD